MEIKIQLRGNPAAGNYPCCRIELNSRVIGEGIIRDEQSLSFGYDLQDRNLLRITHYGKSNRDTRTDAEGKILEDRSLEILGIAIGSVEIMSTVLNMQKFYVLWPDNILKDYEKRNETPPAFLTNNLYMGFNGTYEFEFPGDESKLRYEQLWLDEEQAHQNLTLIKDGKEVFARPDGDSEINKEFDFTIYDLEKLINA